MGTGLTMSKSILSWTCVALALAGVSVLTGHPRWIPFAVGLVLIAAAIATAIAARIVSKADEPSGKRVSNDLVALSAAAVIAVYAAGFHRTKAANDEFEAQRARHRTPRPVPAEVMPPAKAQPAPVQGPPLVAMNAPAAAPVQARLSTPPAASASPQSLVAKNSAHPAATPASATQLKSPPPSANIALPAALGEATPSESPVTAGPVQPVAQAPAASPVPVSIPGQVPAPSSVASTSPAPLAEIPLMPKLKYKDGTFLGWGRSAHGNIQASVMIENGRISQAVIARCETAYSCDWIAKLPGQVLSRQDPGVDVVSGASDSSYAFQDAVSAALFKAQRGE